GGLLWLSLRLVVTVLLSVLPSRLVSLAKSSTCLPLHPPLLRNQICVPSNQGTFVVGPSPAAKAAAAAAKMPATQRQRRYDQVMGDREPDVTDKKFVHELKNRLEIKYYESQQAKEKQLAEYEKKRMRKLVMEGVVESEDKRQEKSEDIQQDTEWKEFWPPNPNKTLEEYEEEKRRAEEKQQKEAAAGEGRRGQQEADGDGTAEGDDAETGGAAPNGEEAAAAAHPDGQSRPPWASTPGLSRLASRPCRTRRIWTSCTRRPPSWCTSWLPCPRPRAKPRISDSLQNFFIWTVLEAKSTSFFALYTTESKLIGHGLLNQFLYCKCP
ncbi:hypothetical protein BOX15_Mlig010100g1, partial [Macrostomum lignano]